MNPLNPIARGQNDSAKASLPSLADLVESPQDFGAKPVFDAVAWIKILVLGGLLILLNYWQFPKLISKWRHDPNWTHCFLIPLFSLYLLYVRRQDLLSAPRRVFLPGLVVLILGILLTIAGFYPIQNDWVAQVFMVLTLLGLVLYLCGPAFLKVTWVPIVYLVLAMPIPDRLYNEIALPLQMLAAKCSGALLHIFGVDITVRALSLEIVSRSGIQYPPLTVAEACSGVRSLMAFVALSVAIAYIDNKPWWHRVVFVLAGIPIAVACNILRVSLTCTMYVIDKPDLGQNLMHEMMGMALLVPALLLLLLLGWFLQRLFIDVDEDEQEGAAGASSEGGRP